MSPANQHVVGSGIGNTTMKKSSVAQTCNNVSLFLKGKSCLKALHREVSAKFDDAVKSPEAKMTIDLLSNMEDLGKNPTHTEKDDSTKTAQMTMIYNGQVVVFDDIPVDRARDVMLSAGSYHPSMGKIETRVELVSSSVYKSKETNLVQVQVKGLDLPITKRASLHKFLAKRKERAIARAPYQLHNPLEVEGYNFKNELKFDFNL